MGLECCNRFPDFDYYANPDDDFSTAPEDCKCESCGCKIKKRGILFSILPATKVLIKIAMIQLKSRHGKMGIISHCPMNFIVKNAEKFISI